MMLVGDVGGTNTRLALARRSAEGWSIDAVERTPTPSDLPARVRQYRAHHADTTIHAAAFCGAGISGADGVIQLTNRDTVLDPRALADAAGVARVSVLNDFAAVAWSITALALEHARSLGSGHQDPLAPRIALGAGTGLGMAAVLRQVDRWAVLPGEGGHTDLAPVDDAEHAIWSRLRKDLGRVTAEQVLSGPGLERLHAAMHPDQRLSAPAIGAALAAGDVAAQATASQFARWLGRFAGNQALALGARGGVYIGGGIVPGWGSRFDAAAFRQGFEDKAPFCAWMRQVPAWVITHPQPGLLGLAAALGAQSA